MADWASALTALIAAGGALSGVWLSKRLERPERERARREERRALLRAKAEELYHELNDAARKNTDLLRLGATMLSAPDFELPDSSERWFDMSRLRALTAMYFPEAMPIFHEFDAVFQDLTQPTTQRLTAALKGGPIDGEEWRNLARSYALIAGPQQSELIRKLRHFLDERAATLLPDA